jgi:hypothetical protein
MKGRRQDVLACGPVAISLTARQIPQMQGASKRAEKISVSVGADVLKRAKRLATRNGVSLSRVISEAIEMLAEEEERRAVARDIVASFPLEARATKAEKEALQKQWATPRVAASKKRRTAG